MDASYRLGIPRIRRGEGHQLASRSSLWNLLGITSPIVIPAFAGMTKRSAVIPASGDSHYRTRPLETHGPLGTLLVGLGLSGFYIALIWINTLLGVFLTPLFLMPVTWFIGDRKKDPDAPRA
jgi:hypothetical protein